MFAEILPLLSKALGETIYMVIVSMAIASAIGVPLGRFIIGLSGAEDAINNALNFLSGEDVRVEVIGYVRRNSAAFE